MNTSERQLIKLIRKGEGIDFEFKTCRNQLNRDVFETVCAFLNRHGDTILLGVTDSGDVQGIEQDAVSQIKKDFVTTINNPQKIHPPAYNPETFTPFPKNPVIAAFFRQIGRADELGSGMRKMMRYGKAYGGADPEMIEGDVFKIVARVPEFGPAGEAETGAQEAQSRAQSGAQSDEIVELLGAGALSAAELVNQLGLKSKTGALKRSLQQLIDGGLAEYTIPDKPTSRLQKYRLTEKGRKVLKGIEGGIE